MWFIRYRCFSISTRPVVSCVGFDGLLQLVRAWTAQGRWPLVMSARWNHRWWQVNRHFNGILVWYTYPFIYNLHQIHLLFLWENRFSHFHNIIFQLTLQSKKSPTGPTEQTPIQMAPANPDSIADRNWGFGLTIFLGVCWWGPVQSF